MLYQVRYLNKDALIIMSAILPRPVDINFSQSKVVQVNRILAKHVSQTKNCSYIRTYRRFIRRGRPLLKLYKQKKYRQWELYLNKSGIGILTQLFSLKVLSFKKKEIYILVVPMDSCVIWPKILLLVWFADILWMTG